MYRLTTMHRDTGRQTDRRTGGQYLAKNRSYCLQCG